MLRSYYQRTPFKRVFCWPVLRACTYKHGQNVLQARGNGPLGPIKFGEFLNLPRN